MQVTAKLRYLRIAPRKMRLLADLVRNKRVAEAKSILDFSLKKGERPLKKLLDSAVASAKNDFQLEELTLYIAKITVDEGPKLKRWRARARGRAVQVQKKTSHITLVLGGKKGQAVKEITKKTAAKISAKKEEASVKMGALSLEEQKKLTEKGIAAAEAKTKKKPEEEKEVKGKEGIGLKPLEKVKKPKRKILSGLEVKKRGLPKVFRRKSF